jgi:hypothetical protein
METPTLDDRPRLENATVRGHVAAMSTRMLLSVALIGAGIVAFLAVVAVRMPGPTQPHPAGVAKPAPPAGG